jgi:hypothetical protein
MEERRGMERTQRTVWIIDRQDWPRAFLRAELIERGFEVESFLSLSHALRALTDAQHPRPHLIVLELRDLDPQPAELETVTHAGIPTLLLAGGIKLSSERVQGQPWTAVLRRPVTIGQVADKVEELCP